MSKYQHRLNQSATPKLDLAASASVSSLNSQFESRVLDLALSYAKQDSLSLDQMSLDSVESSAYKKMLNDLLGGGPGSGCHGDNCGRPSTRPQLPNTAQTTGQVLTQVEKKAIQYYTGHGYIWINHYLREQKLIGMPKVSDMKQVVNSLDSAISKHTLGETVTLYRGARLDPEAIASIKSGAVITDKGFVSTSTSQETAENFINNNRSGVLLKIKTSGDTHAVDGSDMESEIILPRNSQFRIDSIDYEPAADGFEDDFVTVAYATYLGQAKEASVKASSTKQTSPLGDRFVWKQGDFDITTPSDVEAEFNPDEARDSHGRWSHEGATPEESVKHLIEVKDPDFDSNEVKGVQSRLTYLQHPLNDEEESALTGYTIGTYGPINQALRGTTKTPATTYDKYREDIAVLKDAISKRTLPEDVDVFRGAVLSADTASKLKPGTEITDKGFVSTSLSLRTAKGFTDSFAGEQHTETAAKNVLFRINAPKGSNALVVPETSEYEIILPPASKFKIDDVKDVATAEGKFKTVTMTYVGVDKDIKSASDKGEVKSKDGNRFVWQSDDIEISKDVDAESSSSKERFIWKPEDIEFDKEPSIIQAPTQQAQPKQSIIQSKPIVPAFDSKKVTAAFNEDEQRDERGRWTKGDVAEDFKRVRQADAYTIQRGALDKLRSSLLEEGQPTGSHLRDTDSPDFSYDKWRREASSRDIDENNALEKYTGDGYAIVNDLLRNGKENLFEEDQSLAKEIISGLNSLMQRSTLSQPVSVYRGAYLNDKIVASIKPGVTFSDKGFISTSLSLRKAQDFTASGSRATIMRIDVPKGAHAIVEPSDYEFEVILPHGSQFRVDAVHDVDTEYYRGKAVQLTLLEKGINAEFNPDEQRDSSGKWTKGNDTDAKNNESYEDRLAKLSPDKKAEVKMWNAMNKAYGVGELNDKLLKIDGVRAMLVDPVYGPDPDASLVTKEGKLLAEKSDIQVPMAGHLCHWNAAALYSTGRADAIGTGYILGNLDGIPSWFSHSWGMKDGKIIETTKANYEPSKDGTTSRDYFGVVLKGKDADEFTAAAKDNARFKIAMKTLDNAPKTLELTSEGGRELAPQESYHKFDWNKNKESESESSDIDSGGVGSGRHKQGVAIAWMAHPKFGVESRSALIPEKGLSKIPTHSQMLHDIGDPVAYDKMSRGHAEIVNGIANITTAPKESFSPFSPKVDVDVVENHLRDKYHAKEFRWINWIDSGGPGSGRHKEELNKAGWVMPSGKFEPLQNQEEHPAAAVRLGLGKWGSNVYDQARDKGAVRVVLSPDHSLATLEAKDKSLLQGLINRLTPEVTDVAIELGHHDTKNIPGEFNRYEINRARLMYNSSDVEAAKIIVSPEHQKQSITPDKSRFIWQQDDITITPPEIDSEFDPNQARDDDGKWTKEDAGDKIQKAADNKGNLFLREHKKEWNIIDQEYQRLADLQDAARKLKKTEKSAVSEYTGEQSAQINFGLRHPGNTIAVSLVQDLTHAIATSKLPEDLTLYRGGHFTEDQIAALVPGARINDKGFTSTSTSLETARSFAYGPDQPVIMRIKAPKGTPGLIARIGSMGTIEHEVILQRGSNYKVGSVEDVDVPAFTGKVVALTYEPTSSQKQQNVSSSAEINIESETEQATYSNIIRLLDAGGPGSGRHKGPTANEFGLIPENENDFQRTLREKDGKVRDTNYVMHPTKGLIFDPKFGREHANWFSVIGLPSGGPLFDKLDRGYITVDNYRKNAIISSWGSEFVPNELYTLVHSDPRLEGYNIEDRSKGMMVDSASSDGWIGVDFDSTLSEYDGDPTKLGEPIQSTVDRIKKWLSEGRTVKIFTARVAGDDAAHQRTLIKRWCKKYIGQPLPITNVKDHEMIELWDDRAVRVGRNTGEKLSPSDIEGGGPGSGRHRIMYTMNQKSGQNLYVAAFHKDAHSDFYKSAEKHLGDMSDIKIPRGHVIDNLIGFVGMQYQQDKEAGHYIPSQIEVHPDFRRQGIATEMYNRTEKDSGLKVHPSPFLSDDAKKFWEHRNVDTGIEGHSDLDQEANIKKEVAGLPITIEYPAGSDRILHDDDGNVVFKKRMAHHYGEFDDTEGRDGDPVDVILGPVKDPEWVFVIHMLDKGPDPKEREDEDKICLGFENASLAEEAFFKHYPKNFYGGMTVLPIDVFKEKLKKASLPHHERKIHAEDVEAGGPGSGCRGPNCGRPSGPEKLTFIRYGGLSPVKQKGYDPTFSGKVPLSGNFHQPPARHGFYAFVQKFVEPFLLDPSFQQHRHEYVKDSQGNIITDKHPDFAKYEAKEKYHYKQLKDGSEALYQNKSPKKFSYSGPIWSHLGDAMKPQDVMARKGAWVLSSMEAYQKALQKMTGRFKEEEQRRGMKFDKDMFEVFIERAKPGKIRSELEAGGPGSGRHKLLGWVKSKFSGDDWGHLKGWMPPTGRATIMNGTEEHVDHLPSGYTGKSEVNSVLGSGYARYGSDMVGDTYAHYVHFDANNEDSRQSALRALGDLHPEHGDSIVVESHRWLKHGTPDHEGYLSTTNPGEAEQYIKNAQPYTARKIAAGGPGSGRHALNVAHDIATKYGYQLERMTSLGNEYSHLKGPSLFIGRDGGFESSISSPVAHLGMGSLEALPGHLTMVKAGHHGTIDPTVILKYNASTDMVSEVAKLVEAMVCKRLGVSQPNLTVASQAKPTPVLATSKPKCPHCGSKDYGLMPPDFETAKCNDCGRNWNHGIVDGINGDTASFDFTKEVELMTEFLFEDALTK